MSEFLRYTFLQNALLTGCCAALSAAIIVYFIVVRGLTFAAHALPNIGFAGAAGAVLLNIDPVFGLFAFTISSGVGMALLGRQSRERDTVIGVIMTFALGLGLLFLSLYSGFAEQVYSILFGTILGISRQHVLISAISSLITIGLVLVLFRPLLFSSFDPEVARARGLPVEWLSILLMVLIAITVSLSVQIIGTLLVFVLLIGPAATATRITAHPFRAILISMALGVSYTVAGILLAVYTFDGRWPVSFFIATISFVVYLPVRLLSPYWLGHGTRELIQAKEQERNEVQATTTASL